MIEETIKNLRRNNMAAYFVKRREEVPPLVESLLKDGDKICIGGSQTLQETGVLDLISNPRYNFLDRNAPGLAPEQVEEIFRQAFFADVFLCSSNAITMQGELYNVDGNANRVSAMLFGPKSVIVVAGTNKLVKDIPEAVRRVKTVSAPKNAQRLSCDTYCRKTGKCVTLKDQQAPLFSGCASPARICCSYTVMGQQRVKDRVKVILVDEPLGY
jgi:L-lactate utilization protein LutB